MNLGWTWIYKAAGTDKKMREEKPRNGFPSRIRGLALLKDTISTGHFSDYKTAVWCWWCNFLSTFSSTSDRLATQPS